MKKILKIGGMALALLLFAAAVRAQYQAAETADIMTIFLADSTNAKRAEEICEQEAKQEEAVLACFWGEQEDTVITCQETGQEKMVTLLLLQGNGDLLISGAAALGWRENGCCLDKETSQTLFGTREAAGQIIWCQGKSFVVCQTFESVRPVMLRQTTAGEEQPLSGLSLKFPVNSNRKSQGEQFLMRYGLSGDSVDFYYWNVLLGDLLLLFPLLLLVKLGILLLKPGQLFGRSNQPTGHANGCTERSGGQMAGHIGAGLVAILVLLILWKGMEIPADMIPSKWSDLNFWTIWWNEQKSNLLRIFSTAMAETQLTMLLQMLRSFLFGICAIFLAGCQKV